MLHKHDDSGIEVSFAVHGHLRESQKVIDDVLLIGGLEFVHYLLIAKNLDQSVLVVVKHHLQRRNSLEILLNQQCFQRVQESSVTEWIQLRRKNQVVVRVRRVSNFVNEILRNQVQKVVLLRVSLRQHLWIES